MGLDIIGTQVDSLNRAYQLNQPGTAGDYARLLPVAAEPLRGPGGVADLDGIVEIGVGSASTVNRFQLIPFGSGISGSQFKLLVYGIKHMGQGPKDRDVWVYYPLAEFLCTLGAIGGPQVNQAGLPIPPGTSSNLWLLPDENLCDDVQLLRGSLGREGFVTTFGAGSGFVAAAYLDLAGSEKVTFDFRPVDDVSMNCLYSRC